MHNISEISPEKLLNIKQPSGTVLQPAFYSYGPNNYY